MAVTKNLVVKLSYCDLKVEFIAEGMSGNMWNPDVADDVMRRAKQMWRDALEAMNDTDTWNSVSVLEDEDE